MPTLVRDPPPAEFQALLERRARLGLDRRDEVWAGVLHMNPAPHRRHANVQAQLIALLTPLCRASGLTALGEFNLGETSDYRIPDAGAHRPGPDELFNPTAALVVEIISPGDESYEKLDFYAAHGVEELLIVDPQKREVHWLALSPAGEYATVKESALLDLTPSALTNRIDWPS